MSHAAWSVCVCLSLCVLVTRMCPAKMAEPIEMPFGADAGRPKEPRVNWGSTSPQEGVILGVVRPIEKLGSIFCGVRSRRDHSILSKGMTCDAALLLKFFDHLLLLLLLLLSHGTIVDDAAVGWFPSPVVGCTPSPASVDLVSGDQATAVTPDPTTCYAGMAVVFYCATLMCIAHYMLWSGPE